MSKENINPKNLRKDLQKYANPKKARILARFFKTGKGEYGEGDKFLGIVVPQSRILAKKYLELSIASIQKIIGSQFHEERVIAVLILVLKYQKGGDVEKKKIFEFYLANTKWINNWDLVDLSAPKIVGDYLMDKNKGLLLKLAKSKNLWERRIAIIATFQFIYFGKTEWTYKIVKILMEDKHDLIQKACGWMLREAGKRVSEPELLRFLDENTHTMPRTMLRYAIERLPERKRKYYLNLK